MSSLAGDLGGPVTTSAGVSRLMRAPATPGPPGGSAARSAGPVSGRPQPGLRGSGPRAESPAGPAPLLLRIWTGGPTTSYAGGLRTAWAHSNGLAIIEAARAPPGGVLEEQVEGAGIAGLRGTSSGRAPSKSRCSILVWRFPSPDCVCAVWPGRTGAGRELISRPQQPGRRRGGRERV